MLIYCPKCQQGYNVDEELIPEEGRRLRCSQCQEVFWFDKTGEVASIKQEAKPVLEPKLEPQEQEAVESAQEAPAPAVEEDEEVDINDVFKRLSEQTITLFEKEKKLNRQERLWLKFKTMTGWYFRIRLKYVVVFLAIIASVSLYNNRYDVVRKLPFMAYLYNSLGIECQILAEGLEFENITWAFFDDAETPRLEIKGFISNPTPRSIKLPTLHIEMLDDNTGLLKSQNQIPEQEILKSKSRMAINVVVKKPSPTTKYVFLTFVK